LKGVERQFSSSFSHPLFSFFTIPRRKNKEGRGFAGPRADDPADRDNERA